MQFDEIMEQRPLGRTGARVSALCLGTMMFGDQISETDAFAQMDVCIERGVAFFDTAELYTIPPKAETQGESERIVGRWLADRGARDKITLATKVVGRSTFPWIRDGGEARLTGPQIRAALERSLRNLRTDHIDLYQTHWPDRTVQVFGAGLSGYKHFSDAGVPFEETLGALGDLRKEGKIRFIGVSNETAWGVSKMLRVADDDDAPRIASIQNGYNLLNRTFETGLAEIAIEENVGLLAYSPIAQGVLTGKYLDGVSPAGSRGAMFGRLDRYKTPSADKAIRDYAAIADRFGVDRAAFAMQFVTTRPFVTSNIFGANGLDQLQTVLGSTEIRWTDEMEAAVNAVHAACPNPCP